jgi:hypothetical protein
MKENKLNIKCVIGCLQQLENPDDLTVGEAAMGIMADAVSKRAIEHGM